MNLERREPRFGTVFAFVDERGSGGSASAPRPEPPADMGGSWHESTKWKDSSSGAQSKTKQIRTDVVEVPVYTTEPVNLAVPRDITSSRATYISKGRDLFEVEIP